MTEIKVNTTITPMLTVKDGLGAVDFYRKGFDAKEIARYEEGDFFLAELAIDDAHFFVSMEAPENGNLSPESVNGNTTIRIELTVADPDGFAKKAIAAGAKEKFPVADQDYGWRQGRIVDPFGHHWVVGRPL